MTESKNTKKYDLEDRTFEFAKRCRDFCRELVKSDENREYSKQLIRSSGSQAANYIEANESLGKKDFAMKLKICRKEAKESCLWLRLVRVEANSMQNTARDGLMEEAIELRKIFSAILNKFQ